MEQGEAVRGAGERDKEDAFRVPGYIKHLFSLFDKAKRELDGEKQKEGEGLRGTELQKEGDLCD